MWGPIRAGWHASQSWLGCALCLHNQPAHSFSHNCCLLVLLIKLLRPDCLQTIITQHPRRLQSGRARASPISSWTPTSFSVFSLQLKSMLARASLTTAKTPGPCLEAWRFPRAPPAPVLLRTTLLLSYSHQPAMPATRQLSEPPLSSPLLSPGSLPPWLLTTNQLYNTQYCETQTLHNVHVQTPGLYTRGRALRSFASCLTYFPPWLCRLTISLHFTYMDSFTIYIIIGTMYFYVIGLLNNQTKDMWGNVLPQPWRQSMPLPPASDRYAWVHAYLSACAQNWAV